MFHPAQVYPKKFWFWEPLSGKVKSFFCWVKCINPLQIVYTIMAMERDQICCTISFLGVERRGLTALSWYGLRPPANFYQANMEHTLLIDRWSYRDNLLSDKSDYLVMYCYPQKSWNLASTLMVALEEVFPEQSYSNVKQNISGFTRPES